DQERQVHCGDGGSGRVEGVTAEEDAFLEALQPWAYRPPVLSALGVAPSGFARRQPRRKPKHLANPGPERHGANSLAHRGRSGREPLPTTVRLNGCRNASSLPKTAGLPVAGDNGRRTESKLVPPAVGKGAGCAWKLGASDARSVEWREKPQPIFR